MKSALTLLALTSFTVITLFGFVGMVHSQALHAGCIVSLLEKGMCPSSLAPLASVFFHLDTLKSFSLGILAGVAVLGLLGLGAAVSAFLNLEILLAAPRGLGRYAADLFKDENHFLAESIDWLAIHLNSPSVI